MVEAFASGDEVLGAGLPPEASSRNIHRDPSKQEQSMNSTKVSMTWLRHSARASDVALGCPPKVD
jgi:hypothetical protein